MFTAFKFFLVTLLVCSSFANAALNGLKAEEVYRRGPQLKIVYKGYEPTEEESRKIEKAVNFLYFFYQKKLNLNLPESLDVKLRIFGDYYSYKIYQMGFSKSTTDGAF